MMTRLLRTAVLLAPLLAACHAEAPAARISGHSLLKEQVRDLYESPNGAYVATLADTAPTTEPGAPQDIFLGSLWLLPSDNAAPRRLGGEVSNLPGAFLFSPDSGAVALLSGYSVRQGVGELRLTATKGGPIESLGDGVSFFTFSGDGAWIAWITEGVLFLRRVTGGQSIRVTDGVALVEFGPAGSPAAGQLLVKRGMQAGGTLLMDELATGRLSAVARGVTDFGFSPIGDGFAFQATGLLRPGQIGQTFDLGTAPSPGTDKPGLYRVLGHAAPARLTQEEVSRIKLSPKSARVAFLTPPTSGPTGDLFVSDGAPPQKVASHVVEMEFAPDGTLVLLGNFISGSGTGTLGVVGPDGKLLQIAQNVRQFTVTKKGGYILYSRDIFQNGAFSLGFALYKLGTPPPEKPALLDNGVYGYAADDAEKRVAYKAHCVDDGKSCDLFIADLADTAHPIRIAEHVAAFEFVKDGLVVVTSRRDANMTGRILFSLGFMQPAANAPIRTLDDRMSGQFAVVGSGQRHLIYTVDERGREGVYTVDLP